MQFQREKQLLDLLKAQIDTQIDTQIEANQKSIYKKSLSKDYFAAMDADGTLWEEDVNNILLKYQKEEGLRDFSPLLDPYYQKDSNRHERSTLFAKGQAGFYLEELKSHCRKALERSPLQVFDFQRELLAYLKQKNFKVYVVTASLKWLVEVALSLYNFSVDKVLGVETDLQNGKVGSKLVLPAPLGPFKGEVFLKQSQGEKCILAGGNSPSDLPLLEMASVPFVVQSASKKDENYPAEQKMKQLAVQKNWILFEKC